MKVRICKKCKGQASFASRLMLHRIILQCRQCGKTYSKKLG